MNSRERVEMALNFEAPDRVPVFASFVPEIEVRLRKEYGISDADVGVALGNDMVKCCAGMEMSFYGQPEPEYVDAWGRMVGEEGRGVRTIIDMVAHTRLDCVMGSAGLMQIGRAHV